MFSIDTDCMMMHFKTIMLENYGLININPVSALFFCSEIVQKCCPIELSIGHMIKNIVCYTISIKFSDFSVSRYYLDKKSL